jgi:predicted MFS family arabinose efflux permease
MTTAPVTTAPAPTASELAARPWLSFSGGERAAVVVALYFVALSAYMDRFIIAILQEPIRKEFSLSDTELGLMSGFAFAVLFSVLGVPVARWADRGNRRIIITGALVAWSGMCALCGAAQNFWQLFLARVGVGVGEAGTLPPSHSLVGDYFPPEGRSTAFAVLTFGNSSGVALGLFGGAYVAAEYGWRMAFVAAGLPGLILAILVFAAIREPRVRFGFPSKPSASSGGFIEDTKVLLRKRTYVHIVTATTIYFFVIGGAVLFIPAHMMRGLGMSIKDVGLYYGLTTASAAAVGALIGGVLADKLSKKDLRWTLRFPAIAMVVVFPLLCLFLYIDDYRIALMFFFVAWAILTMGYNPIFSAVQAVAGRTRRATAVAFLFLTGTLLGQGLGPVAAGAISDALVPRVGVQSLRYSLMIILVLLLWSAWHFWCARKTVLAECEDRLG